MNALKVGTSSSGDLTSVRAENQSQQADLINRFIETINGSSIESKNAINPEIVNHPTQPIRNIDGGKTTYTYSLAGGAKLSYTFSDRKHFMGSTYEDQTFICRSLSFDGLAFKMPGIGEIKLNCGFGSDSNNSRPGLEIKDEFEGDYSEPNANRLSRNLENILRLGKLDLEESGEVILALETDQGDKEQTFKVLKKQAQDFLKASLGLAKKITRVATVEQQYARASNRFTQETAEQQSALAAANQEARALRRARELMVGRSAG